MRINLLIAFLFFSYCFNTVYCQSAEMLVQIGHTDKVTCIDYSLNGKYLVTGGMDQVIKLWEVKTGLLIRTFNGHKGMVYQVKLSSDNKYIFSCSYDDEQFIKWDTKSGNILQKKLFRNSPISDFCFNQNSSIILAIGSDTIYAMNSELHVLKKSFISNPKGIDSAPDKESYHVISDDYSNPQLVSYAFKNFSKIESIKIPNSLDNICVSGSIVLLSGYKEIYKIDLTTKQSKKIFERDSINVFSSVLLPDQKTIIFGLANGSIFSIDEQGKKILLNTQHKAGVNSIKLNKDGRYLVTASNDWSSQLIETETGKNINWFKSNCDYINHFQLNETGTKLALVSGNTFTGNQVGIWDLTNARFAFSQDKRPPFEAFLKVAYNDKQSAIISANDTGEAFWYNFPKNSNYWSFTSGNSQARCVAVTLNGKNAVVGTNDGQLVFWRPERNKRESFSITKDGITSISISPDQKTIAAGADNGQLYLIDFETKSILQKIESHSINSGYSDTTWVMSYGTVVHMDIGANSKSEFSSTSIMDAKFSVSGDSIVVCGGNRINLFLTKTGEQLVQIIQNGAGFSCVDISNDGKKIAASGADGIIRIYNSGNGNLELELSGHQNEVRNISFSKDPNFIISGSLDAQLKIWNLKEKKELLSAITSNGGKEFIIYNPKGYYFSSKSASTLVTYRIGQKVLPFEQFDLQYNRPDLIMTDLSLFTTAAFGAPINNQLIKSYYKAYSKRLLRMNIDESEFNKDFHIPEVILQKTNLPVSTNDSILHLSIGASDNKYNLSKLHVLVNGVPVFGLDGIALVGNLVEKEFDIILSNGKNNITIYCLNVNGAKSLVESFELTYNSINHIAKKYYIGIGVNSYLDTNFNLKYSSKDVRDLADLFNNTHPSSTTITLTNKQVTRENILKLKEMLLKTNVNDEVVILLSGHGLLSEELEFYYATYDIDFLNPKTRGILFSEIESILDGIPSRKKLLLIDACHSGELDKTEVVSDSQSSQNVNLKNFDAKGQKMMIGLGNSFELMKELFSDLQKGTGTTIIASSSGKYFSFEYDELSNGVFTYSLKEALSGKADSDLNSQITVSELQQYLIKRVMELTKGKQEPTSRQVNTEMDFTIW